MRMTSKYSGERGAVAVIVALCSVVLVSFAAIVIDAGSLWQTRRNMVTATDAASLGAAADYSRGTNGCATTAATLLTANKSGAALDSCSSQNGNAADSGYVTVRGSTNVLFTFAGVLGINNKNVRSTTTAEWGKPAGAIGLRPIGLCLTSNALMTAWLNLPTGPTGTSGTIRIPFVSAQTNPCGNASGNWGVADFDGGDNSNNDTKTWLEGGYPGTVSMGSNVPGNTGAISGSLSNQLAFLAASGASFALPVFDAISGNGSNATMHIVAVVNVQLVAYKITGAVATHYLDLIFSKAVIQGTCCGTGLDTGARVIRICDIDTLAPDTSSRGCGTNA